ncbi:UDP-N-acetylglucosamine 1-carboxyvinyltransferase [Prochlorococcus sp. MIT 1223]|uniref:UDP-N-acetylglucosamine 1-carboxyvinyltransferase n=1 Tax=Prochlorococcus sp. MIT 1223 TaxID=3096217 RepID=UPI0039C00566
MQVLKVSESKRLSGDIKISGAKNSALVLIAASLLTKESVQISNVPKLTDVYSMIKLLLGIGATISETSNKLLLQTNRIDFLTEKLDVEIVQSLRASFFCIGPLLARFGELRMPLPGGCRIGVRPIDEHLKGLKRLGASVKVEKDHILVKALSPEKRLVGAKVKFNCKSVGATETILMAATLAQGKTIIENSAQEPEIQDLANMLRRMGAKIKGDGTDRIEVEGVDQLKGCSHTVMPDRIEAGTFLIASAITRCPLTISPVIYEHIEAVIFKLEESGCLVKKSDNSISIFPIRDIKSVDITTRPYPGFPTDLQAPFMALMTTAKGTSKIEETIFEKRMHHINELNKMGANIELQGNTAFVVGVKELRPSILQGKDLRACAAIVLASLVARGESIIQGLEHLDRGYENFDMKLNKAGAFISRSRTF